MPEEALPTRGRKGKLSYTVSSENEAKVEVLLKGRAFRIIRMGKVDGLLDEKLVACKLDIFR